MFEYIDKFLQNLNLSNLSEFQLDMIASAILCLILYLSVLIVGFLVNKFEYGMMQLLARKMGGVKATMLCNRVTFPGVILHELSHALLVIMTGAKVTKMILFNPFDNKTLGSVEFKTRGGWLKTRIQLALSSCAPVIIGAIIIYFLIKITFIPGMILIFRIIFWYLIISIICHMSMSKPDIKNYLKGLIALLPMTFVLVLLIKYLLL